MIFSSNVFLFAYLPIVLLLYYLSPRKFRNPVLLLVSLIFYGWGEPIYLFLMMATIALDYTCGLLIARVPHPKGKKAVMIVGVVLNLLSLGFFKYAGFFAQQWNLLPLPDISVPAVTLPIGISFYVFQSMSYIIDVYRNDAPVQKNPLSFGTYVTLFPQLIAGPIVRYADVAQQIDHRRENVSDFSSGVMLFMVGLGKKVLLANPMGSLCEQIMGQNGTAAAWMGILAYTLQIYFDFSGYSDMARGLGRMLGFEFLPNFNYPYISRTVTEFWRRWHISLSTWFKEYVYIPLGGNRKGLVRQILNIAIVWALTGFWHGASWNFLLWGIYYAILLILEKSFLLKLLDKLPRFVGHIYTIFAFMMGWVLFYFTDMGQLGGFVGRLFTLSSTSAETLHLMAAFLPLMAVAIFASTPVSRNVWEKYRDRGLVRWGCIVAAAVCMLLCVAALASQSYNPFIYFRF